MAQISLGIEDEVKDAMHSSPELQTTKVPGVQVELIVERVVSAIQREVNGNEQKGLPEVRDEAMAAVSSINSPLKEAVLSHPKLTIDSLTQQTQRLKEIIRTLPGVSDKVNLIPKN